MSRIISISYERKEELLEVLERLEDLNMVVSAKDYKAQDGRYHRCYLRDGKLSTGDKKLSTT